MLEKIKYVKIKTTNIFKLLYEKSRNNYAAKPYG